MLEKLFEVSTASITTRIQALTFYFENFEEAEEQNGFISVASGDDLALERVIAQASLDFSPTGDNTVNNVVFVGQLVGIVKAQNGVFPNFQQGINFLGVSSLKNSLFFSFASGDGLIEAGGKLIDFQNQLINEMYFPFFPVKALILPSWTFPSTTNYIGSGDDRLYLLKYINLFSLMNRGEGFFSDEKTVKMDRRFIPAKPLAVGLLTFPVVEGLYRVQGFIELSS